VDISGNEKRRAEKTVSHRKTTVPDNRRRFARNTIEPCTTFAVVVLLFSTAARAADAPQTVWLASTRSAAVCDDPDSHIRYRRLEEDGEWSSADARDFFATDDAAVPTIVFIHGNRTDAAWAVTKAWCVYQSIQCMANDKPFRFVIWSWPADRVYRRNRDDVRLKAVRCDTESFHLAVWLNRLQPEVKVSLIGHSFGPRIITGAMHLLAGGRIAGQTLPDDVAAAWNAGRNTVRAVLLAAALDEDWLAPGCRNGLAPSLFSRVLITRNGCDRVLRRYPRLYGRGGPEAMGFVGPCGINDSSKIELIDVSATVGRLHDWRCYCSASNVCSRWAFYTFLDDSAVQP